ncbi:uncharacterized protein F5891DRAFT_1188869 [Suillus fuscotomentosus]|uniref:Uncharacterized protein n=1 Tax=Suillus fuscotomentosus TaxID=1912939 RepID=A0AAD4E5R6_9AGAM|nr:uncharacterized protein F5891DRAFT_1188869 [Suillus fuscotomentosus]KAG1900171.1 hypothetical protein F5891DRAFT_1188869 [Suillus fuscotomentosus]
MHNILFPAQSTHDRSNYSHDINNIIDSIPSPRRRTRLQTTAYLLGSRKNLPEVDDEQINQVPECHQGPEPQPQAFEKIEFRVLLNTTDKNKLTTYVGYFYTESDHPLDILDSMKAVMDLPKTYEHLGWCLSTACRTDPPHRLLTSQDISSAFKTARAEQAGMVSKSDPSLLLYVKELENVKRKLCCSEHQLGNLENTFCWVDVSQPNTPHYPICTQDLQEWAKYLHDTRDPDNTCISLPNTPHFDDIRKTRKARTVSLQRVPTELVSPIIHNHVHLSSAIDDMWTSNGALSKQQSNDPMTPQPLKRTFALYTESDEETDNDEPPQDIDNILMTIHYRYPAMDFPRYVNPLKEHGILYLPTAAHFSSRFYVEKVGMTEGAAFTFHTCVCEAHMKEERAKARRRAKGKRRARADDIEKENNQALE